LRFQIYSSDERRSSATEDGPFIRFILIRGTPALTFLDLMLGACATSPPQPVPIVRKFGAHGISRIVLRASEAKTAMRTEVNDPIITVSGIPTGGAKGYHPVDPNWRETPASQAGLNFVSRHFNSTLVISTRNEFSYIQLHYELSEIRIQIPPGIRLGHQTRNLTGSGAPDLSPP